MRDKKQRRAVVVFIEMDGDYDDPWHTAAALVDAALAGDPRGGITPYRIEHQSGAGHLSGRVAGVMDLSFAWGHIGPTLRDSAFGTLEDGAQ